MGNLNKLLSIVSVLFLCGCAGAQLEKEMKESRGYSEADMAAIREQAKEYKSRYGMAGFKTNRFQSSAEDRVYNDMKAIFCKCYREMKSKCREKPDGLTTEQHALWVKSNAVDLAILSQETALDASVSGKVDPDTCG